MSVFCVTLGAMLLMGFILPTVKRLQCEYPGTRTWKQADISSADERLEGQDTQLDWLVAISTRCITVYHYRGRLEVQLSES